jgi:hypothetical protein
MVNLKIVANPKLEEIYLASISGAMYSGLPQYEYVTSSSSISGFDNPKSVIFTFPFSSNKIFYNFTSLKSIFWECND